LSIGCQRGKGGQTKRKHNPAKKNDSGKDNKKGGGKKRDRYSKNVRGGEPIKSGGRRYDDPPEKGGESSGARDPKSRQAYGYLTLVTKLGIRFQSNGKIHKKGYGGGGTYMRKGGDLSARQRQEKRENTCALETLLRVTPKGGAIARGGQSGDSDMKRRDKKKQGKRGGGGKKPTLGNQEPEAPPPPNQRKQGEKNTIRGRHEGKVPKTKKKGIREGSPTLVALRYLNCP